VLLVVVPTGGGLALALVQRLSQEGVALPGALALMAPWCDLRRHGDTLTTLTGIDPVLQVSGVPHAATQATNTRWISLWQLLHLHFPFLLKFATPLLSRHANTHGSSARDAADTMGAHRL